MRLSQSSGACVRRGPRGTFPRCSEPGWRRRAFPSAGERNRNREVVRRSGATRTSEPAMRAGEEERRAAARAGGGVPHRAGGRGASPGTGAGPEAKMQRKGTKRGGDRSFRRGAQEKKDPAAADAGGEREHGRTGRGWDRASGLPPLERMGSGRRIRGRLADGDRGGAPAVTRAGGPVVASLVWWWTAVVGG